MITTTSFHYYNNCDLLNKYAIFTLNSLPCLSKINVQLNCHELAEEMEFEYRDTLSDEFLLRSYSLMKLMFRQKPLIRCNAKAIQTSQISKANKLLRHNFTFLKTFEQPKELISILSLFFIENTINKIKLNKQRNILAQPLDHRLIEDKKVNYCIKLDLLQLSIGLYWYDFIFPDNLIAKVPINVNFIWKCGSVRQPNSKIFKNLFPFWYLK